ncbi:mycofactocin biosynthesis glycosyltransferase MftF [Kribbella sp. NPDC050124]|uniref:mycofactocin biosynthesis glycosyltransferase MftF n=1 Tax=Kribbella sp. NPDC050124 TaxID=3364114 RepID=UPI0037BD3E77
MTELPKGFTVRISERTRVYDAGRTLVGGSPTTVVHLSAAAERLIEERLLTVRGARSSRLAERLLDLDMAVPVIDELRPVPVGSVTIVVPVFDRAEQVDRLLRSVPEGIGIVLVDDCSPDPAAIAAVATAHGATVVRHRENRGPAAARNTGLAKVQTPFAAFVDSDVVLTPETVPTLLRHFHDPKVALAAPRILGLHDTGRPSWITRYENARSSLDLGNHPALVKPGAPVAWVPSACVVVRVAALGDGFDTSLRVAEDVDLVWRLHHRGWRVRYEPAAFVHHEHRPEVASWWARKQYYGTGAHHLAVRHGKQVAPAVLSPWAVVLVAAILVQRRWSLPVAALISFLVSRRIAGKVQQSPQAGRIGLRLAVEGAAAALSQTSALMLRHWWPLAMVGGLFSSRLRRAVVVAAAVDTTVEYLRTDTDLDPVRFATARRLDDLAYGTGVWMSALKHRSLTSLLPNLRR